MKGLVLSAGIGSRLRPLTHTGAKHLIPVANKPILYYAIEDLVSCGISDIGIVVGGVTRGQIEHAVGSGDRFGARVRYIAQESPLGLAHAVAVARDYIGDDRFVVYLGDNIIRGGLNGFVAGFTTDLQAQVLVARVSDPSRFGVAVVEGDRVRRVVEKPVSRVSDLAIVGVYALTASVFAAIERIEPSSRGELELTDAIQRLVDDGAPVRAHRLTDWWRDTGMPEDVLEANRVLLLDMESNIEGSVDGQSRLVGEVTLGKGSTVRNSVIRGPVSIGSRCFIEDCYIGPYTSISDACELRRVEIECSIVMSHAFVADMPARVDSSLLGSNVHLGRQEGPARTMRFVLGDESHVEVSY